MERNGMSRVVVIAIVTWFLVHVALYVDCVWQLDPARFQGTWYEFFGLQTAGFLAAVLVVRLSRPMWLGRVLAGYLILSTLALLGFSHEPILIVKFGLLLFWGACATSGLRQLIARLVGLRYATWGVAAASLYAVLIPVCLLLGIVHAITPWTVAVLAILTALPGAIGGLRHLPELVDSSLQRISRLGVFEVLLLQVMWFLLAAVLVGASTSAVLADAPRVHIPYIHQVVADGGVSHQYPCWHRLQPMAMQTCCAAFVSLGSDIVGTWFSWFALVVLVWLTAEEVFRRSGSQKLGLFAGAAVLGCPLLLRVATSHQIDHVLTLLCTAGFIVLFRALKPPCLRGILFSAVIVGSMVQVKYTGLVFAVVWGLFVTVALLRECDWRTALRWSVTGGVLFVVAALPWYVYVYLGTGNPFYPYLHSWFPSPYWPDGYTLEEGLAKRFHLEPGIGGVLSFPWIATYDTHRCVEGNDGFMGFWILALAPCWFFARSRSAIPYWDMMIAGTAMIAGILIYTPYTRYWMPAYPMLVASCLLAAGSIAQSIRWRPRGILLPVLSAAALIGTLLLPVPLCCLHLPPAWEEYSKEISTADRLDQRFQGYEAIRQLNAILKPSEGVICTDYQGVYQIRGRAYAFALWPNDIFGSSFRIHHLHDVHSFDDFCRRYGVRYWVVSHYPRMRATDPDETGIAAKYWVDSRIVAASGTVTVYDVSSPEDKRLRGVTRYIWPTTVQQDKTGTSGESPLPWIKVSNDVATLTDKGIIALTGSGRIAHRLPMEAVGRMCKIEFDFSAGENSSPSLELTWFDSNGNRLRRSCVEAYGALEFQVNFYSSIPPGATTGWIQLWEENGRPLYLKQTTATFWDLPSADSPVGHSKQSNNGDSSSHSKEIVTDERIH